MYITQFRVNMRYDKPVDKRVLSVLFHSPIPVTPCYSTKSS